MILYNYGATLCKLRYNFPPAKMAYYDDCQGRHGTRRKQTNYLNGRSHPGIELATVQVFSVEKSRFTTSIKKYPRNFFPDN